MATKKACVIYTPQKKTEAQSTAGRLQDDGFDVCLTEVSAEVANAVQAGNQSSLPTDVKDCLDGAEVCVILVDEAIDLGGIGGIASDVGCRVVTVGGDPDKIPTELDDIIDGHVPSPDDPELIGVVEGQPERIKPDHTSAPPRKPDRVKCQ
ncbi:MAG: hypothetical protein ACTHN4_08255 [Sphingomicrobium sp.]